MIYSIRYSAQSMGSLPTGGLWRNLVDSGGSASRPLFLSTPPHSSEKIEKILRHATALLGRSMPRYDCGAIAATKIANLLITSPRPLPYPTLSQYL